MKKGTRNCGSSMLSSEIERGIIVRTDQQHSSHAVVEDMRRLGRNDTIVEAPKICDHSPTTLQSGWSRQWRVKCGR